MLPLRSLAGAALVAALAAAPVLAEDRWVEVRSDHFRVYTNGSERDARGVVTGFETLRRLFESLANMRVDPPAPILVVAARDSDTLRSFLPWVWERRGGLRPAGVFMSDRDKHFIFVDLSVSPDYRDDVVYHEYAHLVTHLNFSGLPLWLNEGLADFYAGTTVMGDKVLYGRVGPRLRTLREIPLLPLSQLFAVDGSSREYNESSRASILYAESMLLTHYFLVGDKGAHRESLVTYLRLRGAGASDEEAQKQAFGDLSKLQKAFFGYAHLPIYMAAQAPLDPAATKATARTLSEAEALALRGDFLARHGRTLEARPLLVKARGLDPQLSLAAQALGRLESESGEAEAARKDLAEGVRLGPDDVNAHYLLAQALAGAGASAADLAESEAAAQRAVKLDPGFAAAQALLSEVLYRRGQLPAAFLALDKACTLEPDEVRHWARRADLLRELKRPDVADTIEGQLAQKAPNDPAQLAALAAYYRARNRPDDLERLLRKASALNPHSAHPRLMLGGHLAGLGRLEEAEAVYREAIAVQPDNPRSLNALAWLFADHGIKLPEAVQLIDRALKFNPDTPGYVDTKAWALFGQGRVDEAEKLLRKALEHSEDADIVAHLGDVLEKRGQKPAAEEAWRRALAAGDASDALKDKLRAKLGQVPASPAPSAANK